MKNFTLLILLFVSFTNTYSQESSVKVYGNGLYFSEQNPKHFDYDNPNFHYSGLTFAYRKINTKSDFYQFELKLNFEKNNKVDHAFKRVESHVRFELGKHFSKLLFGKLDFQFGPAVKIFYLDEQVNTLSYNQYQVDILEMGINVAFFTNIEYDLGDRFYIEMNTSFNGASIGLDFHKTANPNLTERQQKQGGFDFDILRESIVRLGVGFVLNGNQKNEIPGIN